MLVAGSSVKFQGRWSVDNSVTYRRGRRDARQAKDSFNQRSEQIEALPRSVKLNYMVSPDFGPKVIIDMQAADGELIVASEPRRLNGLKFWMEEPMERFIERAVKKAASLAERHQAR